MSIFKKESKEDQLIKYLNKCRKNIPEKYNHGLLLDYLCDKRVDLLFSITTRGDGKTFNYLYLLAKLNQKFDFNTVVLVRHLEIRTAMLSQIRDVYETMDDLSEDKFAFKMNPDYILVTYNSKPAFIICDLNNANDLKNFSAVLQHANLFLYDEFLAVGGEYAPHEFEKFKTIFETSDRSLIPPMEYTNNRRKAIFLANPVDFSSEFLAYWKMYHYLEIQEMNTIKVFHNIAIERRKNSTPQKNKNNRIFNDETNESVLGEFHVNDWKIKEPNVAKRKITIKTLDRFINLYYDNVPILDVTPYEESYQYNTELVDNTSESTYLKPSYYSDNFFKKYTKGKFYFSNQYSKQYILDNYANLNIGRIYRFNLDTHQTLKEEDESRKRSDLQLLKERLFMQYL